MSEIVFLTTSELGAGIDHIQASPGDGGTVEKIVCRPATGERRELNEARLSREEGLAGDNWSLRIFGDSPAGQPNPKMQLTLMNARAIALIAQGNERWQLAGDQLFVDLDLSPSNLPPGTQLGIGNAMIEVTSEPHLGCLKFQQRFGRDAVQFVNSDLGKSLNLRGINAKVITPGDIRVGSTIGKVALCNKANPAAS